MNNNFNNNKILREKKEMALDLVIDLNDIIDDTYVKKFDDHTSKLLQKKILESEILVVLNTNFKASFLQCGHIS